VRAEYPSAVLVDMQPILLSARITPRTVDNSVHLLHLQWLDRWRCTSSRHIIQRGRIVTNNLTMNRNKPKEIVFSDPRRRRQIESPPPATDIARVTSVKILGVTMTNGLSASDHVRDVIRSCARPACVTRRCRPSSGQSPSPSCSMHPVPGLGSPKRLTGSKSSRRFTTSQHPQWLLLARHSYICRTMCHCR